MLYYIAENLAARADEFRRRLAALTGDRRRREREVERSRSSGSTPTPRGRTSTMGWCTTCRSAASTLAMPEPIGVIGVVCPDELAAARLRLDACCRRSRWGTRSSRFRPTRAPLAATDFYQVLETSDVPGGVVNIVTGAQRRAGAGARRARRRRRRCGISGRAEGSKRGGAAVRREHEAHLGRLRSEPRLGRPAAARRVRNSWSRRPR